MDEIIRDLAFDKNTYDLDGLIRLADDEEAAFVFMYFDEDDHKYYRNRYDILECRDSITNILRRIENYLENDEENALFIPFAAVYEGRLTLLDGRKQQADTVDLGELELGTGDVYGMLIHQTEETYIFDEALYHDGGEMDHSWTHFISDAGQLTKVMKKLINQFAE